MSQYLASLACVQQLILHFSTDKMASNLGIVNSYPSDRDGTKAMHYLPSGPPVSKWKQNDSHAVYQTMLCSWRTELHGRRYDLFEQFVNCFDKRATSSCHLLQRSRLTVSDSWRTAYFLSDTSLRCTTPPTTVPVSSKYRSPYWGLPSCCHRATVFEFHPPFMPIQVGARP